MRPLGWRGESYRHYLASKGISTVKKKYQKEFPDLVKQFPGQNPRITDNYARFRQRAPDDFEAGSFRTKKLGDKELVLGEEKHSHKFEVQSILIPREKYFSDKNSIIELDIKMLKRLKARYAEAVERGEPEFNFEGHDIDTQYAKYLIEYGDTAFGQAFFARKVIEKKGAIHVTKSGEEVVAQAHTIEKEIKPYVKESQIVGSIRRKKENPVDVDIVVVPKTGKELALKEHLRRESTKVYQDGARKFSARINGIKTEVIFARPEEYGAAKLTYTGPFGANIYKRGLAKKKGWLLNEKGLFDSHKRRIASSERGIYNRLGLSYREPKSRGTPR